MNFVDIHTHILYGVDDGAKTIENSLEMLELAYESGTTDIILTPHFNLFPWSSNTPNITLPRFNKLKEKASQIPINLYLGNEMRVNEKSLNAIKDKTFNSLNNSPYLLIDFPFYNKIDDPYEYISLFKQTHPGIIVAHIERHDYTRDIELVRQLKNDGFLFQLNVTSYLGRHGSDSQDFAYLLLQEKLVDFVASDAHNTSGRPPILSEGYKHIKHNYGEEYANDLFRNNALNLLIKKEG